MSRRTIREKKSRFAGTKQVLTSINQPAHAVLHEMDPVRNVPIGAILPYGGASAPNGWLMCDGSAISRTAYVNLFTAIGTAFGVGDGSTTFNVPDLRSRFPIGAGSFIALGGSDGIAVEANRTPRHLHAAGTLDVASDHNIASNTENTGAQDRATNGTHSITGSTATSNAADIPFAGVNFIIRA